MQSVLSSRFAAGFALLILATLFSFTGIIPLALVFGLLGGYVVITEMIKKYF